jgi:prophage regulatory protein
MVKLPEQGYLRLPEIIGCRKRGIPALIPVSKSAWWSGVGSGRFPAGVKLGPRTTAWSVKAIRELLARFAAAER